MPTPTALILADTHVPRFRPELPESLRPYLDACDLILHAGDVTDPALLDGLAAHAPVLAVRGNADGPELAAWGAPERLETQIGGVEVAMVHDAGPSRGRPARLARWFPRAELVVYGHSHIPTVIRDGPRLLVNPGSPTWKRRQPHPTVALARLEPGRVSAALVELSQAPAGLTPASHFLVMRFASSYAEARERGGRVQWVKRSGLA